MTSDGALRGDVADQAVWWYRDGVATLGPVAFSELRRLAAGPLAPETLVWTKTFGERWKRLDATLAGSTANEAPPTHDDGRWTESFARFEAHPERNQLSWFGLLGPFAYLYLGMWQRALVIVAVGLSFEVMFGLADYGREGSTHVLHVVLILSFCVRNVRRDHYAFRVLGQPMWPRLSFMRSGYASGGVVAALMLAIVALGITDPLDALVADVTGVWQADGGNVVIDLAGQTKTITYGGTSHLVRFASMDGTNEVVVFEDVRNPKTMYTLSKHWTEAHDRYSVDLLVNDRQVANLTYLRPV